MTGPYTLLLLSPVLLAAPDERLREANFAAQATLERASLERKNQSVLRYLWVDVYAAALYAEPKVSAAQTLDRQRSNVWNSITFATSSATR